MNEDGDKDFDSCLPIELGVLGFIDLLHGRDGGVVSRAKDSMSKSGSVGLCESIEVSSGWMIGEEWLADGYATTGCVPCLSASSYICVGPTPGSALV
jgi:hypothetical protein